MIDRNIVALHMRAWSPDRIAEVTRVPIDRIERAIAAGIEPSDRNRPQAATAGLLMEVLEAYCPEVAPLEVIRRHLYPGAGHEAWLTSVRLVVRQLRSAGHRIINHNAHGYQLVRGEV